MVIVEYSAARSAWVAPLQDFCDAAEAFDGGEDLVDRERGCRLEGRRRRFDVDSEPGDFVISPNLAEACRLPP